MTVPISAVLEAGGLRATKTLHRWTALGILPTPTQGQHPSGNGRCSYYPDWVLGYVARIMELRQAGEQRRFIKRAAAMAAAELPPQAKEVLGVWPRASKLNLLIIAGTSLRDRLQLHSADNFKGDPKAKTVHDLTDAVRGLLHLVQQTADQQLRNGEWIQPGDLMGGGK